MAEKRIFTPTTGDTGLPSAADTPSAAPFSPRAPISVYKAATALRPDSVTTRVR